RAHLHHHAIDVGQTLPAFTSSIQYSARNIYYTQALNGDQENFFGPVVSGNGPTITVSTRNIERTSTAPVQLTLSLQGASLGPHQANVFVNGTLAGSLTFSDQSSTIQTLSVPGSWLVDGDNAIKIAPASATNDVSLVDYLRVTYPHSFRAENDSLQFSLKSTQSARVDGFTSSDIRVVDVTDPGSVQVIRPIIDGSGNAFGATVPGGDRGKARRLVALPATRISQPAWLSLNQPSALNSNTNGADLVIIAYKDFVPSLATLAAQRQAQGYVVKIADVDDVYDEFSFGEHTPQAIRDFMSLAKNTWTRAPSYLLLVGDASYDPRNRLSVGNFDFVPTKLVDTGTPLNMSALEAMSDDWLTDFDGDGIADIAVGRLPVRTVAEANLVVSKIVNYSPANTGNKALLVADTQGSYFFNFEAASDQVATTLPAGMTIQKVYRRLQPSDENARANIIADLNSGQSVTIYSGHGNVDIWGGSIFTGGDAGALTNLTNGNGLSVVVVMDCLNGYFADPSLKSLAESFLSAPNGGAVASFASSGLTIPIGQHEMGLRMFQLLYSGSPMAIGDASRQAKSATSD
ncbi:MAG TPA: C25 family cysteine peptidase, partial [Pyrinomonadaceae bacterium]|nr:C25 family cysteine peptidase [Pyrinomonadaceae bacterium]